MNKTLKWILIGLAIAVGAFIISLPVMFMIHNGGRISMMDGYGLRDGLRTTYSQSPMRMFPMFGLFGFLRLLIPLGVIGLAVYGVVALVRGNRSVHATPPAVPAATAADVRTCAACGKELHGEGEFCPFCGAKQ